MHAALVSLHGLPDGDGLPPVFLERKLEESSRRASSRSKPMSIFRSLEEKYVVAMKKLQFGE